MRPMTRFLGGIVFALLVEFFIYMLAISPSPVEPWPVAVVFSIGIIALAALAILVAHFMMAESK